MTSVCDTAWASTVRAIAVEGLADARRVTLAQAPLDKTVVVEVDGGVTEDWSLDGVVLTVEEDAWDPKRQELVVRYVPAAACGG